MFEHVSQIKSLYHYSAPSDRKIIPYTVQPGFEIVELLSGGTVLFEKNGEVQQFRKGTIFWHVAGENSVCHTLESDPYQCFVFNIEVDRNLSGRPAPRVSCWYPAEDALNFCREAFQAFHAGALPMETLTAYIYSTLVYNAQTSRKLLELPAIRPLHVAMNFIKNHCVEDISVDDVARQARVSRSYLFRLFKTYLHTSPHQYQTSLRIDLAKLKLASDECSIKEIAADCGFEFIHVFYRRFKEITKISPAEYRRKYSTR